MTDAQPPESSGGWLRGAQPPTSESGQQLTVEVARSNAGDGRTLEPWEVFRREKDGDPMRHGGSVMAPDAVLAVHYARELYGRRQESVALWVVRRADIHDLADPDLLQPPLDRSFKKPGGYVMRDKLAAAREQSGQAKPKARSSRPMPTTDKADR
jgi:ring-1,2-phenylacetyl-CoA epoxidase subunit PaaB